MRSFHVFFISIHKYVSSDDYYDYDNSLTQDEDYHESLEYDEFHPFFDTIDDLSENTSVDSDINCPEIWFLNENEVTGCQTELRTDKRPWCSLDRIFRGNFIFCDNQSSEAVRKKNEISQKILKQAVGGLLENLQTDKYEHYQKLLEEAAEMGSIDANVMIHLQTVFGYIHPQEITKSLEKLEEIAGSGNPTAQAIVGIFQGAGFGFEQSQAKSILNLKFSAIENNYEARMALGNRYLYGLGVRRNCQLALYHYQFVADKVAKEVKHIIHTPIVVQEYLSHFSSSNVENFEKYETDVKLSLETYN